MLLVTPSPRELFDRLPVEEKIAVDRFIELGVTAVGVTAATVVLSGDEGERFDVMISADERCVDLVPDAGRRRYLRGLTRQLLALGISVREDSQFDAWAADLAASRERFALRCMEQRKETEARAEAREAWLRSLAPEVRRSVERHQRRRGRRGGQP